ncbi:unnamed protein product [Choristocarpus tenellus]
MILNKILSFPPVLRSNLSCSKPTMPPSRPLATKCRYGRACRRADCFYSHPMGRDIVQSCNYGRCCFRKVCCLHHPDGRLMEQLRPGIDYCASYVVVNPRELGQVVTALESSFPAQSTSECDFVAAVGLESALNDLNSSRNMFYPNGRPSQPENIRLIPRTHLGHRMLQDPAIRAGLKWSPSPHRPWKSLQRIAAFEQNETDENMRILCAGHVDPNGGSLVIELAVSSLVVETDNGQGIKAGARIAEKVLGFPGSDSQSWFVFHVSRPNDDDGVCFVTCKATVDVKKIPTLTRGVNFGVITAGDVPTPTQVWKGSGPGLWQGEQMQLSVMDSLNSFGHTTPEDVDHNTSFISDMSSFSMGSIGTPSYEHAYKQLTKELSEQSNTERVTASRIYEQDLEEMPVEMDDLGELLARLDLTKFRETFDKSEIDMEALRLMSEEAHFKAMGIPLGPRIKLMKELGIKRGSRRRG